MRGVFVYRACLYSLQCLITFLILIGVLLKGGGGGGGKAALAQGPAKA